MKKFVAIAGVVSLVSTVAVAREAEPTIEINVDVLQSLMPPPPVVVTVQSQTVLPTKPIKPAPKKRKVTKHKKAAHKKVVVHKKSPTPEPVKEAPVAIIEPVVPAEKHAAPEIPAVTTPPIPNTAEKPEVKTETPAAAPVKENADAPKTVVAVETPKTEEKPAPAEAPKVDATATPPVAAAPTEAAKIEEKPASQPAEGDMKQRLKETMDEWLLQAGEWRDNAKQWIAEKKEALSEDTTAEKKAAEPNATPEKQAEIKAVENNIPAIAATDLAPEKPKTADADVAPAANPVVEKALAEAAKEPTTATTDAAKAAPAPAPVEIKPAETAQKQPEPSPAPAEEKAPVKAEAPAADAAAPAKQPEPFTVPAEEKAPVKAEAPKVPVAPKTEAERLQDKVDSVLLKVDAWQTRFKTWVENALKPVPATVPAVSKEEKTPEAIKAETITLPGTAPAKVTPELSVDLTKPATLTTTEPPTAVVPPAGSVITPPAAPADIVKTHEVVSPGETQRRPLYTVLFAAGVDEVAEADMVPLDALSERLQQEKDTRINVLGYATPVEGMQESEARKLSLKRAIAVRQLLIKQGLSSSRINVRALGSDTTGVVKDRVDIVKLR